MITKFLMHISYYITKLQKDFLRRNLANNKESEASFSSEFLLFHNCLFFTGVGAVLSLPIKKTISSHIDPLYYIIIIYLIARIVEWALSSYIDHNHKYVLYYPEFEKQHENAKIKDSIHWIFLILVYMIVSIGIFVLGCVLII